MPEKWHRPISLLPSPSAAAHARPSSCSKPTMRDLMPAYRDREARKLYMRQYRAKKKSKIAAASAAAKVVPLVLPDDPVGALAAWAREDADRSPWTPSCRRADGAPRLRRRLPARIMGLSRVRSHDGAEERQELPSVPCSPWGIWWGRSGLTAGVAPWRAVSKEKAERAEATRCAAIAEASGPGRRDPVERLIRAKSSARAPAPSKHLASERTAGHSSSFDLVVVDETGLMPERSHASCWRASEIVAYLRRAGAMHAHQRAGRLAPVRRGAGQPGRDLSRLRRGAGLLH